MKWTKSPETIIAVFDQSLPSDKRIEKRKMFGYPSAFVNGNLFAGVFKEDIMVRLSEEQRETWLKDNRARLFEPMPARPMKEYIEVPKDLHEETGKLKALIKESFEYALGLKPKIKKDLKEKQRPRSKK